MLTITEFIGRFHPLLVHLPIGFLLIGGLLQWLSGYQKYQVSKQVVSLVILIGMIAGIISCITGYLLSLSGDYGDDLVGWHMWMGIGTALISVLLYVKVKRGRPDVLYKILSLLLFFLILITGHLGGSLTHGENYLAEGWAAQPDSLPILIKKIPNVQEAVIYADVVQPLLQTRCYSCHGEKKQKGKLRLDTPEWIKTGGKNGDAIKAEGAESELMKRLLLPREDDEHMPPRQKPQLTEKEIALLHWWVDLGADFQKKVKEFKQPEIIKPYLLALQSDHVEEKKALPVIPAEPVEKAAETSLQPLKDKGMIIIPVSQNSNYMLVNSASAVNVTDADIAPLIALKKQLVWLKLSNTGISDSALSVIGQCTNIIQLQLNNTSITDKGLPFIKNLHQLQSLSLTGTKVTGQGVMQLQKLKSIQSIYLYKTGVSVADWANVKKVFPNTLIDTGGYVVPMLATDTMVVKAPPVAE